MTPEADRFLQNAEKHLERGDTMLRVQLNDEAARAAYLAAFHAAQAVISSGQARSPRPIAACKTNFSA